MGDEGCHLADQVSEVVERLEPVDDDAVVNPDVLGAAAVQVPEAGSRLPGRGDTIYDTSNGVWQNWQEPEQPPGGGAASVAAVGLGADGSAQFLITTGNGGVYHDFP